MGYRGKSNDPADLFARLQAQIDSQAQRIMDLTTYIWEHLPVEFPEVLDESDSAFLPLVVIAASNAPQAWIDYANASPYGFVCDGAADEGEFMAAEDILSTLLLFFSDSIIWLSPGDFEFTAGFTDSEGDPWGVLGARYKGHDIGVQGVDFTRINVSSGWGDILEQDPDTFPGLLVNPLQLIGDFEDITFNFIPDDDVNGDISHIVTAQGKLHNLTFNLGTDPPGAFTIVCETAAGLIGADNCIVNLYREVFAPTDNLFEVQNVTDINLNVFDAVTPPALPIILQVTGMARDITIDMDGTFGFDTDMYPIQIFGDSHLSNVRIFGGFDWTGVDGIVQIAPSLVNDDDPILVDVSTFLVDSVDHPRIFYRDDTFTDIVNLGSRVLHGTTDERPAANMCIGTLYVNTDNPAAPVLEWSDGSVWWQHAAMT